MFAIFPEILHAAERHDQETLACLVRKYFAGQDLYAPRIRVEALLESMGILCTREVAPYFARIQVIDHRGHYRISVGIPSRPLELREVNFTLAHLLGHFLNEFLPQMASAELSAEAYQLDSAATVRTLQKSGGSDSRLLGCSDQFAMALLMPLGMVKKAHQTLQSLADCAGFFNVHPGILQLRLDVISRLTLSYPGPAQADNRQQAPHAKARAIPVQKRPDRGSSKSGKVAEMTENPSQSQASLPTQESLAKVSAARPKKVDSAPQSSSVMRVQQSVASRSYKLEEARASHPLPEAPADTDTGQEGSGLKRLRQLAKKIDRSVDL